MIGATKMWLLAPSKNLGPGGGEHPGILLTSPPLDCQVARCGAGLRHFA